MCPLLRANISECVHHRAGCAVTRAWPGVSGFSLGRRRCRRAPPGRAAAATAAGRCCLPPLNVRAVFCLRRGSAPWHQLNALFVSGMTAEVQRVGGLAGKILAGKAKWDPLFRCAARLPAARFHHRMNGNCLSVLLLPPLWREDVCGAQAVIKLEQARSPVGRQTL